MRFVIVRRQNWWTATLNGQSASSSIRNEAADSTAAPAVRAWSASRRSEVTTRICPGWGSAPRRRMISSSAASRCARGACATSTSVERIAGSEIDFPAAGNVG
jgi:hypothetical protein